VERDEAALARAKADVKRVQATLNQAINDEKRARRLIAINEGYLSQSEMDQLRFNREALEAQLEVANLQVEQAVAQLENSDLNLGYTEIVAPQAGIIIDRKIDPGQTLVAQFQTPELFILAPDMDERMWVHANVVEADVGHVLNAKAENRPVKFYVDAYEGELFSGVILQVRQNPAMEQNVVTYPVVVETPNPEMKLLPGMTANLSFLIDEKKDTLLVPSVALRFLPTAELVRDEDRHLIEGDDDWAEDAEFEPSAEARVQAHRNRRRRHVWVREGDLLKAIEIEFGISDGQYYELVKGDLTEDQELIVAIEQRTGG
jgi:HlyD family secretion protein